MSRSPGRLSISLCVAFTSISVTSYCPLVSPTALYGPISGQWSLIGAPKPGTATKETPTLFRQRLELSKELCGA